jgi:restriction system protein
MRRRGEYRVSIPDFQTMMLPLLRFASDGSEHSMDETVDALGLSFRLSEQERNQLYPSGKKKPIFADRLAWTRTHLKQAGLLHDTRRGHFVITARGMSVLAEKPERITAKYLEQFSEYIDFKNRVRDKTSRSTGLTSHADNTNLQTPKEALEYNYQRLRDSVAQELLITIKSQSPTFFERLVVELLVNMGYGGSIRDAGQAIGRSGDEGIDGIIKEDKLGLDVIFVQAKRWDKTVGRPEVQQFAGALAGQRAKKGVFITTSTFTNEARNYVDGIDSKIVLIDGEQLAQLMIDHNVGVTVDTIYELKRLDSDYFSGD